jgi:hypothetical protein
MKFNWGTGIAITLILFATLMGFMVYQAMQQDFDLVSDNYYQEELAYQSIIEHKANGMKLTHKARLMRTEEAIYLMLPEDLDGKAKDIEVLMYHEQEDENDFRFALEATTQNNFKVPFTSFAEGKWIAKVHVKSEEVPYYFEPEIHL